MSALRLNDLNVRRSVGMLRNSLAVAADYGLSVEACLEGSGIPGGALDDPLHEVEVTQLFCVMRRILQLLDDHPWIGLEVGRRAEITHGGIPGALLLSRPTMRQGLDLGIEQLEMAFTLNNVECRDVGDEVYLVIDGGSIPEDIRRFLIEVDIAGLYVTTPDLLRCDDAVKRVEFSCEEPLHMDRFREVFDCPIRFRQEENAIVFDGLRLEQPLPRADALTARFAEEQCRQILERRRGHIGVAGQVRSLLLGAAGPIPSLEEIARELAMAPRTLRNNLRNEGVSFRELVSEVRRMLAEELLRSSNMNVEEIAERVGYTEPKSFFRAFKRWNGVTPRAYRRQQNTTQANDDPS